MNSIQYWENYLEEQARLQQEAESKVSHLYQQALAHGVDMAGSSFKSQHLSQDIQQALEHRYGINKKDLETTFPQERSFSTWIQRTRAVRV